MDALDRKIRRFLVDEGYLMPVTDDEIERALQECEASPPSIPEHLDNPYMYLNKKKPIRWRELAKSIFSGIREGCR